MRQRFAAIKANRSSGNPGQIQTQKEVRAMLESVDPANKHVACIGMNGLECFLDFFNLLLPVGIIGKKFLQQFHA